MAKERQTLSDEAHLWQSPRDFSLLKRWLNLGEFWFVIALLSIFIARGCMNLEDVQTIAFPIVLLCGCVVLRHFSVSVPRFLIFSLLAFWIVSSSYARGFLPSERLVHGGYMARLSGEGRQNPSIAILARANEIADHYRLEGTRTIHRDFKSRESRRDWLAKNPAAAFLLSGSSDWLTLDLSPSPLRKLNLQASKFSPAEVSLAKTWGLDAESELLALPLDDRGLRLYIVRSPEFVSLPGNPQELSRHFIAWLSDGLQKIQTVSSVSSPRDWLALEDSFWKASSLEGQWPSKEQLGLAKYYLGTLELLEGLNRQGAISSVKVCAIKHFQDATSYIQRQQHQPLAAAIFNNVAVAKLLTAERAEDIDKAREWLQTASQIWDDPRNLKATPRGSRAAMLNLSLLQSAGF